MSDLFGNPLPSAPARPRAGWRVVYHYREHMVAGESCRTCLSRGTGEGRDEPDGMRYGEWPICTHGGGRVSLRFVCDRWELP